MSMEKVSLQYESSYAAADYFCDCKSSGSSHTDKPAIL
jgi:hypothetical protein